MTPDIILNEDVYNLGTFGDVNEPFLARAIADIRGTGRFGQFENQNVVPFDILEDGPIYNDMYIEKEFAPPLLKRQFLNQ